MPELLLQDGTCSRSTLRDGATGLRVGCAGNCWQAPATSADGGLTWTDGGETWRAPVEPRLMARAGRIDPIAVPSDGYAGRETARSLGPDGTWQLVKDSGLRGRGGAYFPVGVKWETARNLPADRKFLLVNAEEGEPGVYSNRHLMEGDPHQLLEGVQIAALAVGASQAFVFINGEAKLSQERVLAALERARAANLAPIPVEVRFGGGGYVLGEESALINAIHGWRNEPLPRPPLPVESGLHARPTVINNAESIANLPSIVRNGVEWFRSVGNTDSPGTKLMSLAGDVRRPGMYEVPLGTPIADIFERWGGGVVGSLGAVLVGGPSGSIIPAALASTALDVRPLQDAGAVLGAGGIMALNDTRCPVAVIRGHVAYNARESCGKCTPCREGTPRLLQLYDAILDGSATPADMELVDELGDVLALGSLCGLGQMAPNPVRALTRHFPDHVRAHLERRCELCKS